MTSYLYVFTSFHKLYRVSDKKRNLAVQKAESQRRLLQGTRLKGERGTDSERIKRQRNTDKKKEELVSCYNLKLFLNFVTLI